MYGLPEELVLHVSSWLTSAQDINALARSDTRLYRILNPTLYKRDAKHYGGSALKWSAIHGQHRTAEKALRAGASCCDIALAFAAAHGHEKIVERLVKVEGINVDTKLGYGRTPLATAAGRGYEGIVLCLLTSQKSKVDCQMPLVHAIKHGHGAIVKHLVATNVSLSSTDGSGKSPILHAIDAGHELVLKVLLDKETLDDPIDDLGRTPLAYAVNCGRASIVKVLLETGEYQINPKDIFGRTPLAQAVVMGHLPIVKLLLATGEADVKTQDNEGMTPIAWAAARGHICIVKLLLSVAECNPSTHDHSKRTPLAHAAAEGHYDVVEEITLDLVMGNPFLRNIFETRDGRYVVPSAVYVDLAYQWSAFLSCSMNENDIREAFKKWDSGELEATCAEAGLPLAIVRSTEEWLQTSQGKHLAEKSIVPIQKVTSTPPRMLSSNPDRPLEGVRVLCLTHAIAGPSAGRTLAEHGASVLQIMYTHGFEHSFVYTYANLGCASSRLNLHKEQDRQHLWTLIRDADVWIDSYRDGALSKFGFGYAELHQANPYLIISKVRAYGSTGPWASRPGFDMQGSAVSGMMALCGAGPKSPAWPPGMVINDYTTGYYGALAIQSALIRRMKEGGGYILSPSLAGTAMSIVKYFQTSDYPELIQSADEALPPEIIEGATNLGYLRTLKPLPILQHTPIKYDPILLNAMGTDLPLFPGTKAKFDLRSVQPFERKALLAQWEAFSRRLENVKRLGKRDVI
ncbi:CoA-transferase family III domain protein [Purpureocillium lavendulum]|uniref:CoA-transferase family III domain protein n=1 Tax=Purpureocillium lavendulum TaxID=1247861 RepID=A0AB34G908_9HYPO|nr:CoA-transferase family III domain protein [Purpureocillium lavendulum]